MERNPSDHRRRPHLDKCPSRRLENIEEESEGPTLEPPPASLRPPETPTETMEFLARSWSLSASEVSRALSDGLLPLPPLPLEKAPVPAEGFAGAAAKQPDKSYSPPISPRDYGELKLLRGVPRGKTTMGGWLRDLKERRKEEARAHNAQVYAATSVAGVAAAVAGIAAGTVFTTTHASSVGGASKASAVTASAAALVASHCVEMARAMGATREQVLTVIQSAVNAQSTGDVMALTAGAATALRGAATLRARLCKDVPGEALAGESFESRGGATATSFVSRGGELLKRTRKGDLHWKHVSISMDSNWQVIIKMKSTHIAGTFVKTKKSVVKEVRSDIAAWPGREAEDRNNERAYFGIQTPERLIEFECRSKCEKQMWEEGIQQILDCGANMNVSAVIM